MKLLNLLLFSIILSPVFSQSTPLKDQAIRVFLDCPDCDTDHIKRELSYVNYVRDRKDAQVHILTTSEYTGAGGMKQTFYFLGQNEFQLQADTLTLSVSADVTEDELRTKQLRLLGMGLIRYVARTPFADRIEILYKKSENEEAITDKWNSWILELNTSTFFTGEQSYKHISSYSTFGARRITEDIKIELEVEYSFRNERYKTEDTTIFSSNIEKEFDHLLVKSINDHWSWGYDMSIESSLYRNYDLDIKIYPALEFNIFPYAESNRKQLRFLYSAGLRIFNYIDTTIYNKTSEVLFGQELGIAAQLKEKWGSINISLEGGNYFHNIKFNRLELHSLLSLSLFKGLSLNIYGAASIIHDQLNLPKGDVTSEDVLLRRRQLASEYDFYGRIGLSYSFGSIYNNVVNPRFGN